MAGRRAAMMEETREKLVAAGRRAFAAQGYANASMDELTAAAGLTRGALYHNFGDKKGLLWAVIEQIDREMVARMRQAGAEAPTPWDALQREALAYIEMALEPEIQRVVMLDGPAVLGDPSAWPNQTECLKTTAEAVAALVQAGALRPVDPEAAARLLNGAALSAALWVAASADPAETLPKALDAYRLMMDGLLAGAG